MYWPSQPTDDIVSGTMKGLVEKFHKRAILEEEENLTKVNMDFMLGIKNLDMAVYDLQENKNGMTNNYMDFFAFSKDIVNKIMVLMQALQQDLEGNNAKHKKVEKGEFVVVSISKSFKTFRVRDTLDASPFEEKSANRELSFMDNLDILNKER